jgi:hypothetical protein
VLARWCLGAGAPSLVSFNITTVSQRQDNMDRASQVLARGVPPGVPRSYRTLADHGNVPYTLLTCAEEPRWKRRRKANSILQVACKIGFRLFAQKDCEHRPPQQFLPLRVTPYCYSTCNRRLNLSIKINEHCSNFTEEVFHAARQVLQN